VSSHPGESSVSVLLVYSWNDVTRDPCRDTLRLWGFRSATTSDGEEALRMVAEHGVRALVLDLDLPGVDTLSVASALRQHEPTRDIAILATTRDHEGDVCALARERGCDAVLPNPVDPDRLAAELEAILAHPGRRCAGA